MQQMTEQTMIGAPILRLSRDRTGARSRGYKYRDLLCACSYRSSHCTENMPDNALNLSVTEQRARRLEYRKLYDNTAPAGRR